MIGILMLIAAFFMAAGRTAAGKSKTGGRGRAGAKRKAGKLRLFQNYMGVLPAQAAAGATVETFLGSVPSKSTVPGAQPLKAGIVGNANLNGVVTNNVTFNFRYWRAGVAQGIFAAITLGVGTNIVQGQELDVPILLTAPNLFLPGDVLTCQMVQNGTGLAVAAGQLAKVEVG